MGNTKRSYIKRPAKKLRVGITSRTVAAVGRLTRMIETKSGTWKSGVNVGLPHNQLHIVQAPGAGGRLNIFQLNMGITDGDVGNGNGAHVGDEITVQKVMIRGMIENALQRPKVNYRVMLIKSAKGDVPNRATLFCDNCGNKLIDQINTERYTIVKQKVFTISASNAIANTVSTTGVPLSAPNIAGDFPGGTGSKVFTMTIPGKKFGRKGVIRYENGTATQVKFYDYTLAIMTYDWYGTPDSIGGILNDVGKINELYSKIYFKDA